MMRIIIATLALVAIATLNLETPVRLDGADREWRVRRVIGVECGGNINKDSHQIQRAIDAAAAGSIVEFGPETCFLSRPIVVRAGITIKGDGGTLVVGAGFNDEAAISVQPSQ